VIDEDTPYYIDDEGRLRIPIAYRRWKRHEHDRRIAALVTVLFDDSRYRNRGI
jgi:hypothetical protein